MLLYNQVKNQEIIKLKKFTRLFPDKFREISIIKEHVNKLMLDIGAHRVAIYEFHNGGKNICGVEFIKYSCTYESVNGIKAMQPTMQNRFVSELTFWYPNIMNNKLMKVTNTLEIANHDLSIHQYMVSNEIEQLYMWCIVYKNKPIGLLEVNYKDSRKIDDIKLYAIRDVALIVSSLMRK
jgi:hypothetical protein